MAWTSTITGGVHTKLAAGTVFSIGLDNSATVGQVLMHVIAADNSTFTSGSTNDILAITDASGNTWTKLAEYTQPGLVGSQGATVAIFYSLITTTINSGAGRMTATFATSIQAAASSKWIYNIGTGSTVALVTGTAEAVNASAGALAFSGLTSNEYLFFRGIGLKEITTGFTPTTNYSGINTATAGGTTISAIAVQGEFRILTGTSTTSDPNNVSCEQASVLITLQEILPGSTYRLQAMLGAGT